MDKRRKETPKHPRTGKKLAVLQIPIEPEIKDKFKAFADSQGKQMTTIIREFIDGKV